MSKTDDKPREVSKTDAEWRAQLDPMQYQVARKAATERPFTGKYWDEWGQGRYNCIGCGTPLFESKTKFDAGCGWPSYYEPVNSAVIERIEDRAHGMVRVEVRCNKCGSHLGHVFPDGPAPTGERFCINSAAIDFDPLNDLDPVLAGSVACTMKLFLDFLPLIVFFGVFQYADKHKDWAAELTTHLLGFMVSGGVVGLDEAPVLLGTIVMSVITIIQVIVLKVMRRPIHLMLWITLALVLVLGGATIYFHNPIFIKWKPSIAYWALALSFLASRFLFGKNLLQEMFGSDFALPEGVWFRLTLMWVAFLAFMGVLNLYVAYSFSTSTWASFKVFGSTALMLVFSVGQVFYLNRHMSPTEARAETAPRAD